MKKSPKKPKKQGWSCRVLFEKILNEANVAWYRDKKFPWEKNQCFGGTSPFVLPMCNETLSQSM